MELGMEGEGEESGNIQGRDPVPPGAAGNGGTGIGSGQRLLSMKALN